MIILFALASETTSSSFDSVICCQQVRRLVTGVYLQAARAEAVRELSRLKMTQQTSDALQRNMHDKYNTLAEANAVLESELQSRDSRDEGANFDNEARIRGIKEQLEVIHPPQLVMPWNTAYCLSWAHTYDLDSLCTVQCMLSLYLY